MNNRHKVAVSTEDQPSTRRQATAPGRHEVTAGGSNSRVNVVLIIFRLPNLAIHSVPLSVN